MKMHEQPLRGPDIRKRNEKLVLNLIYKNNGISQSEVSKTTRLKPPTVLRIFTNLEEKSLIQRCDTQKQNLEKKGRKPVFYCTNPDAFYSIGIDFWSNSASIVVVNFNSEVVYKKSIGFEEGIDAAAVMRKLQRLVKDAIRKYDLSTEKILGIGIGCPGRIDIKKGVVLYYSTIAGMVNYNIKEKMEQKFMVPVHVHNNSSVVALSEYRYGKGKGADSLLLIVIRGGIGGAFIDGGKSFVNRERTILEIGHMSIDINGKLCECGGRGCLETYISEGSILLAFKGRADIQTMEDLEKKLLEREPRVVAELEERGKILALGIRNLFQVFSPQLFIIVSRSQAMSELFARIARDAMENDQYISKENRIEIMSDKYNPVIAGLGAADLVLDHFFSS
jgi:predicted NBD/HSP70 family sugar kinase